MGELDRRRPGTAQAARDQRHDEPIPQPQREISATLEPWPGHVGELFLTYTTDQPKVLFDYFRRAISRDTPRRPGATH